MAIHDTEEEQLEQLKRWWAANNSSLIGGVISAIVIVSGWNYWQNHQQQQRNQAANLFEQLQTSVAKPDRASIDKLADQLVSEFGSETYAQYASLQKAKSKVETNDLPAAKAILQQLLQTGRNDEVRHLARIRLAQLMLATGESEPALKLISAVDAKQRKGYDGIYDELEGDAYVAMDRLDEARNAYQNAVRAGQASPLIQYKLDDIASPDLAQAAAASK